jgi:branched-chain amino acid transport system permease protein
MRRLRWPTVFGGLVAFAVLAFLAVLPHHTGSSTTQLWAEAIYVGIAAMGLNLLTGYNGQVSIGHGAFFGIGAYTTALLMHQHGWQFLPTLLVAAPICALVGVALGFPALRVKGLYLALVTLGFAVVFPDLTKHYVHVTGGTNLVSLTGFDLTPPAWVPTWLSANGRNDQWAYYVTFACALVLVVVAAFIVRGRFGRSLIAVRDHEAAAATVGVNVPFVKVSAFAISALYAGVAGSCSVMVDRLANADKVQTFQLSIEFLVAVVIGGTATIIGPLIGAWLVIFSQQWITDHVHNKPAAAPAVFGIALILFVFVLPDGVVGGGRRLWSRRPRGSPPTPATSTAPLMT